MNDTGTAVGFAALHAPLAPSVYAFIGSQFGGGLDANEKPMIVFGGFTGIKMFVANGGGALSIAPFFNRQLFDNQDASVYGVLMGISIFFN